MRLHLHRAALLLVPLSRCLAQTPADQTANPGVGVPASDVGVAASDVGVAASDVGVAASDVGVAATQALPPSVSSADETFHVAGNVVNVDTDIKITSPIAATHWVSNATNSVSWTGSKPARFSFQLINDDTSILASGISLRASVDVTEGTATCDTPKVKPGSGYYIRFYDQLNISLTVAVSDIFTIDATNTTTAAVANGTASPLTSPSGDASGDNKTASDGKLAGTNGAGRPGPMESFVTMLSVVAALLTLSSFVLL